MCSEAAHFHFKTFNLLAEGNRKRLDGLSWYSVGFLSALLFNENWPLRHRANHFPISCCEQPSSKRQAKRHSNGTKMCHSGRKRYEIRVLILPARKWPACVLCDRLEKWCLRIDKIVTRTRIIRWNYCAIHLASSLLTYNTVGLSSFFIILAWS